MVDYREVYNELKKKDNFFADVYVYYVRGGYLCILVENLLNILTTIITLVFIIFVPFFLNWSEIDKCDSADTCKSLSEYIVIPTDFHCIEMNVCMFVFICIFSFYWLFVTFQLVNEIFRFIKFRNYFKNIGINTNEIKTLVWLDIVKKMIMYDDKLTPETITGSIMKKDNYLIAIIGSNLFKIDPSFYTQSFLWLIDLGILNQIFSGTNEKKKIVIDTTKLELTLKVIAVLQILMLPFSLSLITINYIISLTTDIYTNKTYFSLREWTLYAKLLFREYNELPHIFNDRITRSYEFANLYEQKFNAIMTNILMSKIIYTLGTCLTLLVILTFYDERLVLYIRLFDRNLIWYIAILTSSIGIARLMIVSPNSIDKSAEELMTDIAKHTHYFPEKWKNRCHQYSTLDDFKVLYKYKLTSIFYEIASVFVIPYYIIFNMHKDIKLIALFIENNTVYCENIGHVCKAGLSENLNIHSDDDDRYNTQYDLLIEDDKIKRSLVNFKNYYECGRIDVELQSNTTE